VAGHVADDDGGAVGVDLNDVVPVAADVGALGPGQVAHRVPGAGQVGQGRGQQRLLKVCGERPLGLVEQSSLERLGGQPGEGDQGRALVVVELAGLPVADHQGTEDLAGSGQREEGPRLSAATGDRSVRVGLGRHELIR